MRNIKKKNKKANRRNLLISSVTGQYDGNDYRTDQAIVNQMRSQGNLTPRTEQQIERIIKRMERRSWDD